MDNVEIPNIFSLEISHQLDFLMKKLVFLQFAKNI